MSALSNDEKGSQVGNRELIFHLVNFSGLIAIHTYFFTLILILIELRMDSLEYLGSVRTSHHTKQVKMYNVYRISLKI